MPTPNKVDKLLASGVRVNGRPCKTFAGNSSPPCERLIYPAQPPVSFLA